ncbi:MAG: sulfatase [Candidatus Hydrogenedentota bacterium]
MLRAHLTFLIMTSFVISNGVLAQSNSSPPNIIVLVSDDQRWDAMGAAGNTIIQTPNMDKLAAGGVRFRNAFCTTSICCASRASLLTGMYASTHGIEDFATPLPDALFAKSYPALLREAGYHTGFVGKWGVGNKLPKEQFDFFKGFGGQGKFFNEVDGETVHMTSLIGGDAVEYLSTRSDDQPFCLSVSFKAPHVQDQDPKQFLPDPVFDDLYVDDTMPVAETANEKFYESQPELVRNTEARVRWKKRFSNPEHHQTSVKNYYRLVTGIDTAIGRMLDELDRKGLSDNTVILFLSDHGFFLGERGLAGKWYMYEESIRIPFILYDPRVASKDRQPMSDATVLTIDLAPTITALAGIDAPAEMQGRNLRPLLNAEPDSWRDTWFYEHHFARERENFIPASEGIRTRDWKYIRWVDADPVLEELYHVSKDPLEKHNLADDPKQSDMLARMRSSWQTWQQGLPKWDDEEAVSWSEPTK